MPLRALLMRLFLIVALFVNGPGIAGASMQMQHTGNSPGDGPCVTTVETAAEAMAACHGTAAHPPAPDDHHCPPAADQTGEESPPDDCCEMGNCTACVHHCSAAIGGAAQSGFTIRHQQSAEAFLSVHASAAPTNHFRPPIR